MGTEFWWFYDILAVAITVGVVYKCTRKGFMSSIAGFIGTVVAFAGAILISASLAEYVYDNFIYGGIAEKIVIVSEETDSSMKAAFNGLRNIDMSKATVSGKSLAELNLEPDDAGKVTLELSSVDLSETGIRKTDLSFFGIDVRKVNFKDMNLNKLNIKAKELEETDIGTIVLSRTVSSLMLKSTESMHGQITKMMEEVVPGYSKATEGGTDLVAKMLAAVIKTKSDDLKTIINDELVRPTLIVPVRAMLFAVLFAVIEVIFSLIVKSLGLVSGIPVIGTINTLLGCALGLFEAAFTLFVISIGIGLLISITGDNIIFLNTMTINRSKIFTHIYNMKFLNFKI